MGPNLRPDREEPTLIKRGNGKSLQMEVVTVVMGKWTVIKWWEMFHCHVWILEGTHLALDVYFQRRESWSWCIPTIIFDDPVCGLSWTQIELFSSHVSIASLSRFAAARCCQSFPSCRWRVASMPISFTPGLWGPASTKSSAWRVFQASGTMSWTEWQHNLEFIWVCLKMLCTPKPNG